MRGPELSRSSARSTSLTWVTRVVLAGLLLGEGGVQAGPGGTLPSLEGPEPTFKVEVTPPPARPTRGVKIVAVRGEAPILRLGGDVINPGQPMEMKPGQTLELEGEGTEVDLVLQRPEDGYILHLSASAPCRIRVTEAGELAVEQGESWAHLFRTLAEALSPFTLNYDQVNTGFESTEVAFTDIRGKRSLVVVEGRVVVAQNPTRVVGGQSLALADVMANPRKVRHSLWEELVARGTTTELALLPEDRLCPRDHAGSLGELHSQVCFASSEARATQLKEARPAALEGEAIALEQLGDVYLSAGLMGEAAGIYRRALRVEASGDTYRELGNALWARGEPAAAGAAFGEAVKLDPQDADAWYNRGVVATWEGELESAEQYLERAVELKPELGAAWSQLGEVRLARGDAAGSVQALRQAEAHGTAQKAETLAALARALRLSGDLPGAVTVTRQLVQVSPHSKWPWYELARAELANGHPADALRAYEQALQLEMMEMKN